MSQGCSLGVQVSDVPLKGLAGKTDGIVAQNLERGGEWLSPEQGVSPTFICPPLLCNSQGAWWTGRVWPVESGPPGIQAQLNPEDQAIFEKPLL